MNGPAVVCYNIIHMRRMELAFDVKIPALACGADMKGAFALAKGRTAYLFDGFGDLGNPENFASYRREVRRAVKLVKIKPQVIACDLHPDYFSTRFAEEFLRTTKRAHLMKIQHHEAHIAAGMADNRLNGSVTGVAFDGTGFGPDGSVWGGEFFVGNPRKFIRVGHIEYAAMPGGEAAVIHPWRMAQSYIYKALGRCEKKFIARMIDQNINSPRTSSAGRLFDGIGSIILGIDRVCREAEIPQALERAADVSCDDRYGCRVSEKRGVYEIGISDMVRGVCRDRKCGLSMSTMSSKFHNALARATADTALKIAGRYGTRRVVLSGGVFLNGYLLRKTSAYLEGMGLEPYPHRQLSPGDPCIPVGQLAIAAAGRAAVSAPGPVRGAIKCA